MTQTDLRGDSTTRESLARWLVALLASVLLASTLLLELARMRAR